MMPEGVQSDNVGEYAQVLINREIYKDSTIFKAAYWLTDRYYIFLDVSSDGRMLVEFRPKASSSAAATEHVSAEFCNHLIDFRLRDIVLTESGPIREALVTKAFSEGVVKPGLAGAISDERVSTEVTNPGAYVYNLC
jgi:His-Xaa-Ser system protein HxsD